MRSLIVLSALAVLSSAGAVAAPTKLSFSAITQFVAADSGLSSVGKSITGEIVFDYDPTRYVLDVSSPTYSAYSYGGAPYLWSAAFDTIVVNNAFGVEVLDNGAGFRPSDAINFSTKKNGVSYGLTLLGPNESFVGSALLIPDLLNNFWTSGILSVRSSIFGPPDLIADVTSISVSTVPEPAGIALVLAGLSMMRHRRSQRARAVIG